MQEIEELIKYTAHAYMRELLGHAVYIAITVLLIILGFIFLVAGISNSNVLLGDPKYRDKSNLGDIEYLRTRHILRIILIIGGIALISYNAIGLMA